jgi:hypothetical protein
MLWTGSSRNKIRNKIKGLQVAIEHPMNEL